MHEINDLIVQKGKIVLTQLPYADGQHVRVIVVEAEAQPAKRASISEIRQLLKGSVERFDEPTVPMIPNELWEILK